MKRLLALLFACAWLCLAAAHADEPQDLALEQRLARLSAELRCLVCQNQSLADSHADLAIDLKNQVRDMMRAGRTDAEIKDYLTQRYGDFVLYRPPVKGSTWLLWAGPFALLLASLALLARYLKRRQARLASEPADAGAPAADVARARALLAGQDDPKA